MFKAENENVLVAFQSLCEQYPRENPVALWEMAGGQIAAQQSVQRTGCVGDHDLMLSVGVKTCTVCGKSTHPPTSG